MKMKRIAFLSLTVALAFCLPLFFAACGGAPRGGPPRGGKTLSEEDKQLFLDAQETTYNWDSSWEMTGIIESNDCEIIAPKIEGYIKAQVTEGSLFTDTTVAMHSSEGIFGESVYYADGYLYYDGFDPHRFGFNLGSKIKMEWGEPTHVSFCDVFFNTVIGSGFYEVFSEIFEIWELGESFFDDIENDEDMTFSVSSKGGQKIYTLGFEFGREKGKLTFYIDSETKLITRLTKDMLEKGNKDTVDGKDCFLKAAITLKFGDGVTVNLPDDLDSYELREYGEWY